LEDFSLLLELVDFLFDLCLQSCVGFSGHGYS
jgi:hypothetical protein